MYVITIDGPAASGKTSVSRLLAQRLGWSWVSTGAFYRGLAYVARELDVDLSNEEEVAKLTQSKAWEVRMSPDMTRVFFKNQDVTQEITSESVGSIASQISQYPKVRNQLLPLQRACVQDAQKGLIAEGRDCGSIVFPQAKLKIYLTARSEDRAKRRALEQGENLDHIVREQAQRDSRDLQRTIAPLQISEEARVLDTSDLELDQVLDIVENWAKEALLCS